MQNASQHLRYRRRCASCAGPTSCRLCHLLHAPAIRALLGHSGKCRWHTPIRLPRYCASCARVVPNSAACGIPNRIWTGLAFTPLRGPILRACYAEDERKVGGSTKISSTRLWLPFLGPSRADGIRPPMWRWWATSIHRRRRRGSRAPQNIQRNPIASRIECLTVAHAFSPSQFRRIIPAPSRSSIFLRFVALAF